MRGKLPLGIGLAAVAATAGAVVCGRRRWEAGTRELRARLEAAREPVRPAVFRSADLAGLPAPVERFFRAVLAEGQPLVAAATIEHAGTFAMGEGAPRWRPFTSHQRVVTRRPGFDWDARIALVPGLAVYVHDAYVAGEGILQAALLGLLPVADLRGGGEIARGELLRFLAESAWYPTALLPGQGVRWETVDDRSARATLADGAVSVTLLFHFQEDGPIDAIHAEARGRTVGSQVVPTPWQGRFWGYAWRGGMRVPSDGEVAWLLPEGPRPYWRGRIARIDYDVAS
jgi:uncharacterized protein DUF6920